jgi:hypothetical protein
MKKFIAIAMLLGPTAAFATPLESTYTLVSNFLNALIPLLITLAVVVFFWGLVKYIMSASDEAAKEGGKNLMIWGMIALFVMVAFWGIIGYFQQSLGLSGSITSTAPPMIELPTSEDFQF